MSETHDPWDYLAEFIEGNAVRPPGGQQAGSPRYPLVPSVARELRQIVVAGRAARAAEATQHQQEIAAKNAEIDRCDNKIDALRFSATELLARLAAVEAERDKQAEQIAMLLTICPNCAGLMAPEPPDSGCSGVYCPECRSDSAELRAERDRLKAALMLITGQITGWHKGSIGSIGNVYVGSVSVEEVARLRAALSGEGTAKP